MARSQFLDSLAGSAAALVQDYDLTGMLVRTIGNAVDAVGADDGGLLVLDSVGDLELLSATSHAAAALETYQALSGEGPCQACVAASAPAGFSAAEVADRWPAIGKLMTSAGFVHVLATPLLWRGTALGGLNLFWREGPHDLDTMVVEAQVFADMLTLVIVNCDPISPAAAQARVDRALEARAVVEQAKGVVAYREDLDMEAAYQRLLELERATGTSLTEVARSVILSAQDAVGEEEGEGREP